jgi:hypothetical protein
MIYHTWGKHANHYITNANDMPYYNTDLILQGQ